MVRVTRQLLGNEIHSSPPSPPSLSPSQSIPPNHPLTISETYRLIQNFYPKNASEQYFLQNAPDIIPLTIPTTTNINLSWTPYTAVQKFSARSYLLGMILYRNRPTGYGFCVNVMQKGGKRGVLFRFVGKHFGLGEGGAQSLLRGGLNRNPDRNGEGEEFVFEIGKEQGNRQNVVFGQTILQLAEEFEEWEIKRGGLEWMSQSIPSAFNQSGEKETGNGDGDENSGRGDDWSFLISPRRKTPLKSAIFPSSPISLPFFTPISEIQNTKAWFRSVREEINPDAEMLPSSPISLNSRSRSRSRRVLPKIVSDTDKAMRELNEVVEDGVDVDDVDDLENVEDVEEMITLPTLLSSLLAHLTHHLTHPLPTPLTPLTLFILILLLSTFFILGYSIGRYVEKAFSASSQGMDFDCRDGWVQWLGCYELVMG